MPQVRARFLGANLGECTLIFTAIYRAQAVRRPSYFRSQFFAMNKTLAGRSASRRMK